MNKIGFKERVLNIVRKIPKGGVLSYKQVAMAAGASLAARAVGNIMKANNDDNVPCHRVIRSDGRAGGYNGRAGDKITILRREGYKGKL
jgi:O-6-methylguanine DNA methyltransferase